MENVIEISKLTKDYPNFQLEIEALNIPSGTIVGLIGENGAGKSTLIQCICNIVKANYEVLNVFNQDLKNNEKEIKEDLAVIFDKTHYDLNLTPKFIGNMLSKVYKKWNMDTYNAYLERFNLPIGNKLKTFSKGMTMKLEFAIAFSHDPKLLILDEATSGLDPIVRDEVLELLREFTTQENHSVLLSSHITSDLDKIADYIAYIHQGKLYFMKSYDDIKNDYGIINGNEKLLESLNEEDVVGVIKQAYSTKILVKNRQEIKKIFTDLEINCVDVEDLMIFYAKGNILC